VPTEEDIRAYERRQPELERYYLNKFVVFHGGQLSGVFEDFESAANETSREFGDTPVLIRKVGEPMQGQRPTSRRDAHAPE
jgi:hypothetical protein